MTDVRSTLDPDTRPSSDRPVSTAAGLTLKAALILGFSGLLALWLLTGYGMSQQFDQLELQTSQINRRYMRSQEALSNVRAQVLLASVLVRDALLDPAPGAVLGYQQKFETTFGEADRFLRQYEMVFDTPEERAGLAGLRREVSRFHAEMLAVIDTDTGQWPRNARLLLQERVVPQRQAVMTVTDEVTRMNRAAYIEQGSLTANVLKSAQQLTWRRFGVTLGASLLIGVLSTLYASFLETRLRRQRERDLRITNDLHRLSARLATAQEDERRSIARELHDEVGQSLTAIKVELSLAQRHAGVPPPVVTRLEDARLMAEGTMQTIRDLTHLLHPPLLDDLGLPAALEHQLETFTKRHGIRADVRNEGMAEHLAPEVEVALYRIVQEALTNIAKHAHASSCRVFLQDLAATVRVTIEDDGSGFDPAEVERQGHSRGLGLIGIRERAEQLGGTFRLETAPGQGTRITINMPARAGARTTPAEAAGRDEGGESSYAGSKEFLSGQRANLSR